MSSEVPDCRSYFFLGEFDRKVSHSLRAVLFGGVVVGGGGGEQPEGNLLAGLFSQYRWFALPPCWWTKQKKICPQILHKNGSELSKEKNLIVPVHQHGRHDVTCKPSIVH